ncbi:glycoside hydrolase family 65 protein [Pseudomonas sp. KSR10]|uniref:glycoside hydrolase family 65 protein n=1 Tax=Pseudomonas sp. KSR10 TaxID=2916654 RepID=UPI001EF9376D|nr:glycoside hydrolase family 65 protein [Pseudomonas sp. KSR10]MCG6539318.1 glycoside hydrolase family 65 protein [Pseudomonas sp. KSR10]
MGNRQVPCKLLFDHYDPADERRREALLAQGNGLLSCRASAPEASAWPAAREGDHYAGFYRAGWYDQAPREVNGSEVQMAALVNLPDPFGLSFALDGGDWFRLDGVELHEYRQSLALDSGLLERELEFELGGHRLRLHETRFVSMAASQLVVLRWELNIPPQVGRLRLRTVLNGGVTNAAIRRNQAYEGPRLRDVVLQHEEDGRAALGAGLADDQRRLVMATQVLTPGMDLRWQGRQAEQRLQQEAECRRLADGRLIIEKRVLVRVDQERPAEDRVALAQLLEQLPGDSFIHLQRAHSTAWARLWQRMRIDADDARLELTLRFHAFHLLQTVSPHSVGHDIGFPPRGWTEGYYGQVFWDELFAFPFLVTHFPELARSLLDYRHRRLDKARERARRAGLRGALFPWRSAHSGEEETPPRQFNPMSGRWMADHTYLQRHIGSAVAYDAWQLYLATGDEALLAGAAGEIIIEVARFWASLARFDPARQRYLIGGVIGPDEYHNGYPDAAEPGLDNNAYTNLMAVWTLCRALQVLELLPESRAAELADRLQLTADELSQWTQISRRMYLPFIDEDVLNQFDGFEQLQAPPQQWLHGDRPRLDWMLEARHDSSDRYQLTKQADALMAYHLLSPPALEALCERLGYHHDEKSQRRTLAYHLARITHESSLSNVVCAGALAAVDGPASWTYFQQALNTDLHAPGNSGTQEGVHLGAMCGALDVLQRHYLGVRLELDGLHIFPAAPPALGDLTWQLVYRQAWIELQLRGGQLRVTSHGDNQRSVPVQHAAGLSLLEPGQSLLVPCRVDV